MDGLPGGISDQDALGRDAALSVVEGDITQLAVDAVVNAANEALRGGGGVYGAIHRAAGPELIAHCRTLGGCPTGEVRITPGYRMAARHIIHAVGPVWHGGIMGEAELLSACYRNALMVAMENRVKSIAFPAISTGVYGYPPEAAVEIAVTTVEDVLANRREGAGEIIFCCFDAETANLYRDRLSQS